MVVPMGVPPMALSITRSTSATRRPYRPWLLGLRDDVDVQTAEVALVKDAPHGIPAIGAMTCSRVVPIFSI